MNNETYFNLIKGNYENLDVFYMRENTLFYQEKILYMLPLDHITLANINPNLFLLSSRDIYSVLYMLELLPKKNITPNDKIFINDYVNKYLNLESKKLANEEVLEHEVDCLGMPIYFSDDPSLTNTPCSVEIHEIIEKNIKEQEGGKSKGPKLVLTNPNFMITNDEDTFVEYSKAGFSTFLLIAGTVIITCVYIAIFIAK